MRYINISPRSLQSRKIDSYIGFAVRSGSVIWGLDELLAAKKRVYLIMRDADMGGSSARKADRKAQSENIPLLICKGGEIAHAVHKENVKLIALTSKELADAILRSDKSGIITEVESE